MGGILAVITDRGDTPDDGVVRRLLAGLTRRGPDRTGIWREGLAVLAASRAGWEWEPEDSELIARHGDLVVAADASLYYRVRLVCDLTGFGHRAAVPSIFPPQPPMNTRRPLFGSLVCAGLLGVAGCGDRSVLEPERPVPTISFSYSVDRTGAFQAQGDVLLDAEQRPRHGTWAAALQVPGDALAVTGTHAHAEPHSDVVLIALNNVNAAGAVAIDPQCGERPAERCAAGMVAFRYNWQDGRQMPEALYILVSGSVTVSEVTPQRIRGTFRGIAGRVSGGTGFLLIERGEFDVPVTAAQPLQRTLAPATAIDAIRSLLTRPVEP